MESRQSLWGQSSSHQGHCVNLLALTQDGRSARFQLLVLLHDLDVQLEGVVLGGQAVRVHVPDQLWK